ncbi:MAG: CBS domain-containing protein [Actinobacteria bacterium]|nr:CBS domain-containing protein [Actinomycetota bacterium]
MTHNATFFDRYEGLTFDDVVVVPGYSDVLPDQADTSTVFARDIHLNIPLVSAAMDKVTEARLAIAMARCGGIGVVHRNLGVEDQAAEVQKVKRSQSGMISDAVTLPPTATLDDAEVLMNRFKISGVPITNRDGVLVGILTNRDVRFCSPEDYKRPVTDFMTSEDLVTAPEGTTLEQARSILQKHRIEKLPLVDGKGRLRVAAAVGVGGDLETRVEALARAGVDALVIDTAHGNSAGVVKAIERIKASWPELAVVAGNVVDEDGVETLHGAGVDAVKVGVGAGSICTTRVIAGAGMPQLSAVWFASQRAQQLGVPTIADGGVTYSGDLVKALAAGASSVMLGGLLAGTDEAPGELELFEGRRYKSYRGMGSLGAMQGHGADRYGSGQGAGRNKLVPEGIEGRVAYAGSLADVVYQLVGGLRSGMGYVGAATLPELHQKAKFMRVTTAGREESHPHDVTITHESPNYHRST